MVGAAFRESIIARAISKGLLEVNCHQIREYTTNKQGKVDDYPYSGGPGLIMAYQPIADCMRSVSARCKGEKSYRVYLSPQGTPFTQDAAKRLSEKENLILLCGHYEGIDERVIEDFIDEEVSLGDFVLTGGEIPAMAVADCVARLIPGVLSSAESTEKESHSHILLEYPQYTRPAEIAGKKIPEILLSGNHDAILKWQLETAENRTRQKRPDLFENYMERKQEQETYYFDNSATTKQYACVTAVMEKTAKLISGNPSSLHHMGLKAEHALRAARKSLAAQIGASEQELYFTSCATESNNWALRGYLGAHPRAGKRVLISAVEHPSVTETASFLVKLGYDVQRIPVGRDGIVDLESFRSLVTKDTALVSVLHVNSEVGAVQPVGEIAAIAKAVNPNCAVHTDCVQSFGKLPVQVKQLNCDLLSVSAHKIHGPRGVGFLYVRSGLKMEPLLFGGGQERGMRSGTENLPGIAGVAEAARVMCGNREKNFELVTNLNHVFRQRLSEEIRSCVFLSEEACCSPYILNVSFPGLRAEVILHSVESKGVYLSVGSACSSHKKDRSTTLMAMGCPNPVIDGAVRISFSDQNTMEQAGYAANVLCTEVKKLYGRRKGGRS